MVDPHELLRMAREDLAIFSNDHKLARERWVVDRWLFARGLLGAIVGPGGDPPDLLVDGCGVEVVELLEPGRRRGAEYKAKLEAARTGLALPRGLTPRRRVIEHGHEWVLEAIRRKAEKYDATSEAWTLLVYANLPYADRVCWEEVEASLGALRPPFDRIEVVFDVGHGPRASTLYLRQATAPCRTTAENGA